MKKISLLLVSTLVATFALAQDHVIESAAIALRDGLIEDAKVYIDKAAENESTRNSPKMWYYRGKVYLIIASEDKYKPLDAEAGPKSLRSYINCLSTESSLKKKRFTADAELEYVGAVPPCFNYGLDKYQRGANLVDEGKKDEGKQLLTKAVDSWSIILEAYPYDKTKEIDKLNLPRTVILQNISYAAIKAGDNSKAKEILTAIMQQQVPIVDAFTQMAFIQLEEKDTAAALSTIEKGRLSFPDNKNLITLELNIYQQQGHVDALIHKLTEAIENDPGNPAMLFNRGSLLDNMARNRTEQVKLLIDSAVNLRSAMRKAKTQPEKDKIKKQVDAVDQQTDKDLAEINRLDSLAVADYKDAYEADADYYDAIFNLGALYFNRALPLIEKANNLPVDKDYEKKYDALKAEWTGLYKEALQWFLKAEEQKPTDGNLLYSIQQTYAQLGDEQKAMEYKKKRD